MAKYRKKPVVIEAIQFNAANAEELLRAFVPNHKTPLVIFRDFVANVPYKAEIRTLEGTMLVEPGDFVIQGVEGELYPCKSSIFAATYEPVED